VRVGEVETIAGDVVQIYRLFDKENGGREGQSRQELLWSLPHEIPSQVAMDDEGVIATPRKRADVGN
jgi:hypothetical protein